MKKIAYITGTRAEYGLMAQILKEIKDSKDLDLMIYATGMHIMEEFGNTINEIKEDGFDVREIDCKINEDSKKSTSLYVGELIKKLTLSFSKNKPDFIFVNGDRAEAIASAIVGNYLMIPVVHSHGGDISSTVDEHVRHATTKLAHIHLAATKESAQRILNMGEEEWRVHVVGSPGVYGISKKKIMNKKNLYSKFNLDEKEPFLILIQHPVSLEINDCKKQIKNTLEAIKELNIQTIVIYPNSDSGGRSMIKTIKEYENIDFIKTHKNINHSLFVNILYYASAIIGNSSSAIIESCYFRLPAINIGTRQKNRQKSENVINCNYDSDEIKDAVNKALSKEFKEKIRNCSNLYFKKDTGKKIISILKNTVIDDKLLQKQLRY